MCRVLRFHGSEDKQTFTAGRLQLAPRRAAGGRSCCELRPLRRRLERRPHRGRRALRGARPGRARRRCRPSPRARGTSTTSTSSAARSASSLVAGLSEARHRDGDLLLDAAAPAAGVRAPRLRRGLAAGDRALRARMPRAADVADARRGGAARGRATPSRPSLRPERRLPPDGAVEPPPAVAGRRRRAPRSGVAWYATYEVGFQIARNPGWDAYWKQTILIVIAIKLICLAGFGAYNKWWRYISLRDIMALVRAIGIATHRAADRALDRQVPARRDHPPAGLGRAESAARGA